MQHSPLAVDRLQPAPKSWFRFGTRMLKIEKVSWRHRSQVRTSQDESLLSYSQLGLLAHKLCQLPATQVVTNQITNALACWDCCCCCCCCWYQAL